MGNDDAVAFTVDRFRPRAVDFAREPRAPASPVERRRWALLAGAGLAVVPGLLMSATVGVGRRHVPSVIVLFVGACVAAGLVAAWAVERSPVVSIVEDDALAAALKAARPGTLVAGAGWCPTSRGRPPLAPSRAPGGIWYLWDGLAPVARGRGALGLIAWGLPRRRRKHAFGPSP